MARGRLRIYLGAAPGVGKTVAMLDEGRRRAGPRHRRRRRAGRDPRRRTPPSMVEASRSSRARRSGYRGTTLRGDGPRRACSPASPTVALVDELAHTNVAGLAQREALAGHRRAAGCRDRRHLDGQHPAPRVAQRRRRVDHRRRAARDGARRGGPRAPTRSSWSTCRPRRCAAGWPTATSTRPRRSTPRWRTTSGSATSPRCASSPCCGSPTGSTRGWSGYRADHGIDAIVADPRARRRRALRRPRGRDPAAPRGPDRLAGRRRRAARRARRPRRRAERTAAARARGNCAASPRSSAARSTPSPATTPAEAILDFARGVNATQVVVGSTRRKRWRDPRVPSITEEVISRLRRHRRARRHPLVRRTAGAGACRGPRCPRRRVRLGLCRSRRRPARC